MVNIPRMPPPSSTNDVKSVISTLLLAISVPFKAFVVLVCANLQILADILNTAMGNFVPLFRGGLATHSPFGIFKTPYGLTLADFDYLRVVYNGYTH